MARLICSTELEVRVHRIGLLLVNLCHLLDGGVDLVGRLAGLIGGGPQLVRGAV